MFCPYVISTPYQLYKYNNENIDTVLTGDARLCADSEGYIARTGNRSHHLRKGKEFATSPPPKAV
jgi:hypothetical protein